MFEGLLAKLYLLCGAGLLVGYLGAELRGAVFSGTDGRPSPYAGSSGSGSGGGGGGVFFWGSGYRGGK
jgi:hypothetical protein